MSGIFDLIDYRIILRRLISKKRIASILLVFALLFALGGFYLQANPTTFLSSIALAQASVLAIVFSVTILGVQLIANRYSPRMTELITGDEIFRITFWLLVGSIAIDLSVAYFLPGMPDAATALLVAISFLIASVAVFALWVYINVVLSRSTPEGLLDAYDKKMTPAAYWNQYQQSRASKDIRHPFHDVYEMVMASLSNREWLTATKGLSVISNVEIQTIRELSKDGVLGIRPDRESRGIFEDLLEDYLPRIAIHANEFDEREISTEAIRAQSQVGRTGIENYRPWLASEATQGLRTTIQETRGQEDQNYIRNVAFDEQGKLLSLATAHPDPRVADRILMLYRNEFEQLFYRNYDHWKYQILVDNCFRDHLPDSFENILNHYGAYYNGFEIDWAQDHPDREIERISAVSILFALRRSLITITTNTLDFESGTGEFPGTKSTLVRGWKNICESACESEAEDFSKTLLQNYIELAYVDSHSEDDHRSMWSSRLASLWSEGHKEMIIDAFDKLADLESPQNQFHLFQAAIREPVQPRWKQFLDGIFSEENEFGQWLNDFRVEVEDRAE